MLRQLAEETIMQTQTIETVIYASLALLGPILPAYILYKNLPSRATVKGPFKGFSVQLTGAFAGYFILFLSTLSFVSFRPKPPTTFAPFEVWQIKGTVSAEGINRSLKPDDFRFSSRPPLVNLNPDGSFSMAVAVNQIQEGIRSFPVVIIERDGYETVTLDLNNQDQNKEQEVQFVASGTPSQVKIKKALALSKEKTPNFDQGQEPQEVGKPTGDK